MQGLLPRFLEDPIDELRVDIEHEQARKQAHGKACWRSPQHSGGIGECSQIEREKSPLLSRMMRGRQGIGGEHHGGAIFESEHHDLPGADLLFHQPRTIPLSPRWRREGNGAAHLHQSLREESVWLALSPP